MFGSDGFLGCFPTCRARFDVIFGLPGGHPLSAFGQKGTDMPGATPASNHAALALLRAAPDAATSKFGFIINPTVYENSTTGGPCTLTCESAGPGLYALTAGAGTGGDWYFPYVTGAASSQSGGVGSCIVPSGQADGVIVTTGAMNGCALQVNKSGTDFYFYHDLNGNSLAGKPIPGTVVCRLTWADYVGQLDPMGRCLGMQLADSHKMSSSSKRVSAHDRNYCIIVHRSGRWRVYFSAIVAIETTMKEYKWNLKAAKFSDLAKGTDTKSTEIQAFKPCPSRLITTFPDS